MLSEDGVGRGSACIRHGAPGAAHRRRFGRHGREGGRSTEGPQLQRPVLVVLVVVVSVVEVVLVDAATAATRLRGSRGRRRGGDGRGGRRLASAGRAEDGVAACAAVDEGHLLGHAAPEVAAGRAAGTLFANAVAPNLPRPVVQRQHRLAPERRSHRLCTRVQK